MIKYCVYLSFPGSNEIKQFVFDSFSKAVRFEAHKLCEGWTGHSSPDLSTEIDVPGYEQLRLF